MVRAEIPARSRMARLGVAELIGCICLVIQLPWMVGGTGFLVWEMIQQITEKHDTTSL